MNTFGSRCRIVALTAYVNIENVGKCEGIGMMKVMNKPAKAEDIKRVI